MDELTAALVPIMRERIVDEMRERAEPNRGKIRLRIIEDKARDLYFELARLKVADYEQRRVLALWRRTWRFSPEIDEAADAEYDEALLQWEADQELLKEEQN